MGFVPAEVFPPGSYIQDELDDRGWTQDDLAAIMGRPRQAVNEIIKAKKRVTEETAKELEAALGIDAALWMKMEALYRLHHAEPAPTSVARHAALRARTPLRNMLARGWIQDSDSVDALESRVLRFLEIKTLSERAQIAYAAKQTDYAAELSADQEAWILRVKHIAEGLPCAEYSEEKLAAALELLRPLRSDPMEIRHIPRILAEAGVRLVIVEPQPSLKKVDGVCLWLDSGPVIGMTLRFDRIDNFWFVLLHEIAHVLNRDGTIVDVELDRKRDDLSDQENRANAMALDFCVPSEQMETFMARVGPLYSEQKITAFANYIGVHPGLVAGQLRSRLDNWKIFAELLVKIRHIIIPACVVDGFGNVLPALDSTD
ncbi:MAG: helix-turn-helix domain-containing protein [Gemmatimonadales bacterium]